MSYPFLQARWRTEANRRSPEDVRWIVLHDAETPEGVDTALSVARYFQTVDRKASAHWMVDGGPADGNEIVQCVLEKDIAYGAASANRYGIHIEQAGRGAQSRAEWLDGYGRTMLPRVARLIREISGRWNIPLVFVDAAGLKAGKRGITTHAEVSKAWPSTGHTDPGAQYPLDYLFDLLHDTAQEDWMDKLTPEEQHELLDRLRRVDQALTKNGTEWDGSRDSSIAATAVRTDHNAKLIAKKVGVDPAQIV